MQRREERGERREERGYSYQTETETLVFFQVFNARALILSFMPRKVLPPIFCDVRHCPILTSKSQPLRRSTSSSQFITSTAHLLTTATPLHHNTVTPPLHNTPRHPPPLCTHFPLHQHRFIKSLPALLENPSPHCWRWPTRVSLLDCSSLPSSTPC